jgi:hypothetical protein
MNKSLIWTAAGVAAFAAGLAGAQTYSTYPTIGYGNDASQVRVVRCESIGSRRNFCRVDTRGGVQVSRQLSRQACVRGRNWQATADGISVTGGCRAEFVVSTRYANRYETTNGNYTTDRYGRRVYGDRYTQTGYAGDDGTFHCQSNGHGRTYCGLRGQHYRLVYRSPSCQANTTFGNDAYGTWVSGTCNADFSKRPYSVEEGYSGSDDGYYDNRSTSRAVEPAYGYGEDTYGAPMGSDQEVIYCQPAAYGRTYCGDRNRTYSLRHGGNRDCVQGETYGRDSYGTWVSGSCNLILEPGDYEQYP